ncbi:four helix bundle protein [Capnocytophaga haemolytica]|uniref:Four helix bundle protein n=1 Tax=Capnocytophaga haemolytica TaxID=45243 RepID=A0AAX2H0S3_9FLAO|nr:four helix bundle protein [Capnocytophaga haemolytica]AMD84186.1 four helix bundle protein [Capnocytophaga haemolytica]SFN93782.1 four helix bundle protein [Capnocytophaga haemolytica]SNV12816.1 four helix bundle protein [Capnocytophaga haemolytica]
MKNNITKEKSFLFAIRIVNLYKYLTESKREFVLSKQVLRSGTAVGAMIREAEYSESKEDFIHKLAIAQKEMNETLYWLELLFRTNYINTEEFDSIANEGVEIMKLLVSSTKTAKNNLKKREQ